MTVLEVEGLSVRYGPLLALADFDLAVDPGQIVAVVGANGAGKSTLLRALSGLSRPSEGVVRFDGADITRLPAHRRVQTGIAIVPEGRRLFKSLSVEENLRTGEYRARKGPWSVERVLDLFPWMKDRRRQSSAQLSGGEQQAVAIGRALIANPRLLLMDEVSLGLAPIIVKQIYETLPVITGEGTAVLLVEQDVTQSMRVADYVTCLLEGRSVLGGNPSELGREAVEAAYFGTHEPEA